MGTSIKVRMLHFPEHTYRFGSETRHVPSQGLTLTDLLTYLGSEQLTVAFVNLLPQQDGYHAALRGVTSGHSHVTFPSP